MTRYEIIKDLRNSVNFTQLIASGIISISIATWLQVYETYLEELKHNDKPTSIQFTADYYNLSNRQIYKVISFMEL